MKRLALLLASLSLAACSLQTTEVPNIPSDPATETFASGLGVDIPTMTKTANGAYYKELSVGTGATLTGTPLILYTYAAYLKNGAMFQSNAVTVPQSLAGLVFGMQEGMQGMKVGGERLIVIPSALGYGNTTGLPIPPNSTVIFDVRLDQIP
jgi:FKBP-type peptidyl-prolyl cis-trans isomerase